MYVRLWALGKLIVSPTSVDVDPLSRTRVHQCLCVAAGAQIGGVCQMLPVGAPWLSKIGVASSLAGVIISRKWARPAWTFLSYQIRTGQYGRYPDGQETQVQGTPQVIDHHTKTVSQTCQ
eukprot:4416707-Pleurochrysis_carterae.AAC.1